MKDDTSWIDELLAQPEPRFKVDEAVWVQIGNSPQGRLPGTVQDLQTDVYSLGSWQYEVATAVGAFWFSEGQIEARA